MKPNFIALIAGIASCALTSPAMADVKAGVDAWSLGKYDVAVKEWQPLAQLGDADAQFNMAQAYRFGRGVPVDMKLAEDWYRKAAAQGHFQAEDNLGLIMFQNNNQAAAMPIIEKSANRGDSRAQYVLGTALFNGDYVAKDWVRAYAMMTRASAAGLPRASASLAQMDTYIPVEQRQQGLALARDIEAKAAKPQMPSAPTQTASSARIPAKPSPSPIRGVAMPASSVATAPKPVATQSVKPPAPKPAPQKPAPVAAPGKWRIQLGAFGNEANARSLWQQLENGVAGLSALQPYLVKSGSITRLQAGPLASRPAADKLCSTVSAAGKSCLVVAP